MILYAYETGGVNLINRQCLLKRDEEHEHVQKSQNKHGNLNIFPTGNGETPTQTIHFLGVQNVEFLGGTLL